MSKESMLVMSKESMLVMIQESMLVMIQESMLVMGVNRAAMARHGLILWENEATGF